MALPSAQGDGPTSSRWDGGAEKTGTEAGGGAEERPSGTARGAGAALRGVGRGQLSEERPQAQAASGRGGTDEGAPRDRAGVPSAAGRGRDGGRGKGWWARSRLKGSDPGVGESADAETRGTLVADSRPQCEGRAGDLVRLRHIWRELGLPEN